MKNVTQNTSSKLPIELDKKEMEKQTGNLHSSLEKIRSSNGVKWQRRKLHSRGKMVRLSLNSISVCSMHASSFADYIRADPAITWEIL